jgi:hypothetical protein
MTAGDSRGGIIGIAVAVGLLLVGGAVVVWLLMGDDGGSEPGASTETQTGSAYEEGLRTMHTVLVDLDLDLSDVTDPAALTEQSEDWTPEQQEQLDGLVAELQSADLQAAGEAIDDHYRQEC